MVVYTVKGFCDPTSTSGPSSFSGGNLLDALDNRCQRYLVSQARLSHGESLVKFLYCFRSAQVWWSFYRRRSGRCQNFLSISASYSMCFRMLHRTTYWLVQIIGWWRPVWKLWLWCGLLLPLSVYLVSFRHPHLSFPHLSFPHWSVCKSRVYLALWCAECHICDFIYLLSAHLTPTYAPKILGDVRNESGIGIWADSLRPRVWSARLRGTCLS